jgi:hypothetical protein
MNHLLQPRMDPTRPRAYPVCALSDFYCLRLRLSAYSSKLSKYICCNELPAQPLSPYANPGYPAHQKLLNRIQRP